MGETDFNVTVLTVTARLFLVLTFRFRFAADRFTVCNLRLGELQIHANTLIDAATRLSMTDETLRIMWERDHERMVKWMADVRSTLDMLRE